ncbi:MAG: rhodanese-like domain-containing protein [Pontibacterium sp.]
MEKLIEFIGNHPFMMLAWAVSIALLLWNEKRRASKAVSPAIATKMINKEDAVLVDVRPQKEWSTGHISGSIHIPLADFSNRISELNKFKSRPIIVICNLGQTASGAAKQLSAADFENVVRLQGGITEWKAQSLPVVK